MSINLSSNRETVTRPEIHFVFVEKTGPFFETAPVAWAELFPLVGSVISPAQITGALGLSKVDSDKPGDSGMIYQAGLSVAAKPAQIPHGLQYKRIEPGKYARYLLTGSYSQISGAFEQIFRSLSEDRVALRNDFCVENYLNNPRETPEENLLTEILIPLV